MKQGELAPPLHFGNQFGITNMVEPMPVPCGAAVWLQSHSPEEPLTVGARSQVQVRVASVQTAIPVCICADV